MCAISMPTVLKLILNVKVIYTLVACKVLLDSNRKKKIKKLRFTEMKKPFSPQCNSTQTLE